MEEREEYVMQIERKTQRSVLLEVELSILQRLYGLLYEFSMLNNTYVSEDHQQARKHIEDALSIIKNLTERSREE
jgi:hypothetical protein